MHPYWWLFVALIAVSLGFVYKKQQDDVRVDKDAIFAEKNIHYDTVISSSDKDAVDRYAFVNRVIDDMGHEYSASVVVMKPFIDLEEFYKWQINNPNYDVEQVQYVKNYISTEKGADSNVSYRYLVFYRENPLKTALIEEYETQKQE